MTTQDTGLLTILEMEADLIRRINNKKLKYGCYQDLVLELGTHAVGTLGELHGHKPMKPRQCYYNAFMLATSNPDLTYCEGYGESFLGIPVPHAWVIDSKGRVIDPTWMPREGEDNVANYIGVKFSTDFILRRSIETGWTSIFANDWERDAEVLRLGLVMEDDVAVDLGEQ